MDDLDDAEARRLAVSELARRAPAARDVAALGGFLADVDWRVRKEAAVVASRLAESDPAVVAMLVRAVEQDDDVGLRNSAIESLVNAGRVACEALVEALSRAHPDAKKFLCAALAGGDERAVPALAAEVRAGEPNTATVALESLARIGGTAAEAALASALGASDPVMRLAALEGLASLGASVPVAALERTLGDPLSRRLSLRLLGHADDPRAWDVLLEASSRAPTLVDHAEIAVALGRLAARVPDREEHLEKWARSLDRERRTAMAALLEEGDVTVARAAARVLALAREPSALRGIAILAARAELGPDVLAALDSFGEGAAAALLDLEGDDGPRVALDPGARAFALELAADLLASRRDRAPAELVSRLRSALRGALGSHEEPVVAAAARALALWAEPEDAPKLVALGQHHSAFASTAASGALRALARSSPQSVELALVDATAETAAAWSAAVASLPPEHALEKLREALASEEPRARRAAVMALAQVGTTDSAELASMTLADEDADVQVAAVEALAELGARDAAQDSETSAVARRSIHLALSDESAAVRAAAARASAAIGDADAIPALRALAHERHAGVVVAALAALHRLRDPGLDELLVEALGHADPEVVKEALRAIADAASSGRARRIATALSHGAWDVRLLAARLLGEEGGADAARALDARAAIEGDDLVRAALAEARARVRGA